MATALMRLALQPSAEASCLGCRREPLRPRTHLRANMHPMRQRVQQIARRYGVEIGHFPPRYHDVRRGALLRKLDVDLVIDVGANEGQYASRLRHLGDYAGRIVSLEPGSAAFARLADAAREDQLWDCRRLAMMDRAGGLTLNIAAGDDLNSFLPSSRIGRINLPIERTAEERVATARLDEIFDEVAGDSTPWLKIDVQGAENSVLDGAGQSLRGFVGIEIEMPLVPVYEMQATASETIARLEAAGFRLVGVHPGFFDAELGLNLEFDGLFLRSSALDRLLFQALPWMIDHRSSSAQPVPGPICSATTRSGGSGKGRRVALNRGEPTITGFTLAALSWSSPRTLERCLSSWAPLAAHPLCQQRLIWFQERTDADSALATSHGFEALGSDENIGVGPAYRQLLDRARASNLLFLEDDWRLHRPRQVDAHINAAVQVLRQRAASIVRLRSRRRPGWPVNPSQIQNREMEYPYWLLDCAFWEPHPEALFPEQIVSQSIASENWLLARAPYAGWTNNPHLAPLDFLQTHVRPYTFGIGKHFEGLIDEDWRRLSITVAQGAGLFTHDRRDGPGFTRRHLVERVGYPMRLRWRRYLRP